MPAKNYNVYMRAYMKRRYYTKMALGKKLLGGKCVRCGSTKRLQFDHIERRANVPGRRQLIITKIWTYSDERFRAELKKCQLLCRTCHDDKSRENKEFGPLTQRQSRRFLTS